MPTLTLDYCPPTTCTDYSRVLTTTEMASLLLQQWIVDEKHERQKRKWLVKQQRKQQQHQQLRCRRCERNGTRPPTVHSGGYPSCRPRPTSPCLLRRWLAAASLPLHGVQSGPHKHRVGISITEKIGHRAATTSATTSSAAV